MAALIADKDEWEDDDDDSNDNDDEELADLMARQ